MDFQHLGFLSKDCFSLLTAHRDHSSHGGWPAKAAASAGGRLNDL